jgi:hypothetical protein
MATAPSPGRQVVRFGACEADLRAGDLRTQGLRIGLRDGPSSYWPSSNMPVRSSHEDPPSRTRVTRSTPITRACATTFRCFDNVLPLCSGVPR